MRDEDGLPTVLFDEPRLGGGLCRDRRGAGDATIQTQWNPVTQRIDVTLESAERDAE
jgi:hypothetical protein